MTGAWRELLERHHELLRRQLVRYRGKEVDTAGDGFFASFDGPARAIRCARAIVEAWRLFAVVRDQLARASSRVPDRSPPVG